MKIALASGGKDSLYASYIEWPPDLFLFLVYEFPVPSPHIVNMKASIATLSLTGVPVLVVRVPRVGALSYTARVLARLNASTIVAGDVYIEDHLRYMESLASEAGARLKEPLWGRDTRELLYEIVGRGFTAKVTGVAKNLDSLLGAVLDESTVGEVEAHLTRAGADPLGENGEYHTVVTGSPVHGERLCLREEGVYRSGDGVILSVEPCGMPWLPGLHPSNAEVYAGDEEREADRQ